MAVSGPIIIVEDDIDDQEMIGEALKTLNVSNRVIYFDNGVDILNCLKVTSDKPLLILSDVNMPIMNGLELRNEINNTEYLRRKSIPFIFLSTNAQRDIVTLAYELTVQGFYAKPTKFAELQNILKLVVDYWKECKHPNSF